MTLLVAFFALIIERVAGYPDRLFRLIGHPVTWMGRLVAALDRTLNREGDAEMRRRRMGVCALVLLIAAVAVPAFALQALLGDGVWLVVLALLATSLLAQRSLGEHVEAVADALEQGGLPAGRSAVSQIVGRDPETLDEAGVCRAAIESLAENFSDGIVAPAFWLAVGGLPGGVAYKAINTADSMIGHRTPRHQAFGWASARLDDLVNLPASRLTALLIIAAAALTRDASPRDAWQAMLRDAKHHKSPNAGWPEAAMAGALGLALAGPRSYGGVLVDDVFMGQGGRREATAADIRRALALYRSADVLLIALAGVCAAIYLAVRG
ncbi:adenosylcobinamide-phosphate synthase CbiB [Mesorhizobium sp. CAU 1732]|uniref:adenosylcobinamide-phosphate synthase CbiB n=1 Tax=Mesorhizobium sp. CAU 1732 TaxID=3140358 RepID=UPI003260BF31